ncbi:MAG: hypothetical protein WDA22_05330 [Bacteroidota bacterium]
MKNLSIFTLISAVVFLLACEDASTNTISDINKIVFPDSKINYYKTIQPLFNIGCAVNGCHDVQTKESNLDLSDYLGIKQRFYDVVIVRDTVASRLIWYIDGRMASAQWHRPLNSNQVRGFKQWILEGATDTIK